MATQGRYLPDWTIGKLTLEAGSVDFTTTDSLLVTAEIQPGDTIITASGLTLPIAEITGENAGKLAYPCPAAAAGVDQPLRIRYQSEASRYTGMAASLFKMLGGGNLFSLGELQGAEGEYLRFLAPGVLEAVAGGNLDKLSELEKVDNLTALAALALAKNKLLGVNNDGDLSMLPIPKAVVYDAAQELTATERGQALANAGAGVLAGYRNKVINGNFDIWQRGTMLAAGAGVRFLADRWYAYSVGSQYASSRGTWSFGQTVVPGTPTYYLRTDITSVAGANNLVLLRQPIEDVTSLAGRWVTVTFYAWANANRKIWLEFTQAFGVNAGGSEAVQSIGVTEFNLTSTPAKYQACVFIPGLSGKTLGSINITELTLWFEGGSGFATRVPGISQQGNGSVFLSRISLVEGDATAEADPFAPRHYQQEMALCQRYFQTFGTGGSWFGGTTCYGDLKLRHVFGLPARMRVPPSITRINAAGSIFWNGGWLDVTVVMQPLNEFTVQVVFDVPGWTGVPESPGILSRLTNFNETLPVSFQLSSEF